MTAPSRKDQLLAADYVLDLLAPPARQRVEARLPGDPGLQALVSLWSADPDSLVAAMEELDAPPRIWEALLGEGDAQPPTRPAWRGFVAALGIGELVIGTAAAALLAFAAWELGWMIPETEMPETDVAVPADAGLLAEITAPGGAVQARATLAPGDTLLRLSLRAEAPGEGRAHVLWLLQGGAPPRALAVLAGGAAEQAVPLSPEVAAQLTGALLALTEEDDAFPLDGVPTGDVLASGRVAAGP